MLPRVVAFVGAASAAPLLAFAAAWLVSPPWDGGSGASTAGP